MEVYFSASVSNILHCTSNCSIAAHGIRDRHYAHQQHSYLLRLETIQKATKKYYKVLEQRGIYLDYSPINHW